MALITILPCSADRLELRSIHLSEGAVAREPLEPLPVPVTTSPEEDEGVRDRVFLLHMPHLEHFPQFFDELSQLFRDENHKWYGVNVLGDFTRLQHDFPALVVPQPSNIFDQMAIFKNNFGPFELSQPRQQWSLQRLAAQFLNIGLPKSGEVRTGDWEVDVLSDEQVEYAAMDVILLPFIRDKGKLIKDVRTALGLKFEQSLPAAKWEFDDDDSEDEMELRWVRPTQKKQKLLM